MSFPPLFLEDADSVRARFDADATAALDPSDPRYPDLTPGGMYWTATQPSVLECVRLWDAMTEMVAAQFPGSAWGEYLDLAGETIALPRKDAAAATGVVTFTGPVGTLIAAGTVVSTEVLDPSSGQQPVEFTTQESVTIAETPGPTSLALTPHNTGGALAAGTYFYRVSAIDGSGNETIVGNEESAAVVGVGVNEIDLAWVAVGGATHYNIYRGTRVGAETFLHQVGAVTTYTDNGAAVPTATLAPTNTADIAAAVAGSAGNVAAGTVVLIKSPVSGSPSVTNADSTSGGADVESDAAYRTRLLLAYGQAEGAGTQADYVRWALGFPPIGFVTIDPLWAGAGTVRVIVTDESNKPVSALVVAALQDYLDPTPGAGDGVAPIGAIVTVATPASVLCPVAATITYADGYSVDGAGGTIALRTAINASIEAYVNRLPPGSDVILNNVIGRYFLVPGVVDVSGVTLNGVAANFAVSALQVAYVDDGNITLS